MKTYRLRYARVVILETTLQAENEDQAQKKATDLEYVEHTLGLRNYDPEDDQVITPFEGSEIVSITDYDPIWEVSELDEWETADEDL